MADDDEGSKFNRAWLSNNKMQEGDLVSNYTLKVDLIPDESFFEIAQQTPLEICEANEVNESYKNQTYKMVSNFEDNNQLMNPLIRQLILEELMKRDDQWKQQLEDIKQQQELLNKKQEIEN